MLQRSVTRLHARNGARCELAPEAIVCEERERALANDHRGGTRLLDTRSSPRPASRPRCSCDCVRLRAPRVRSVAPRSTASPTRGIALSSTGQPARQRMASSEFQHQLQSMLGSTYTLERELGGGGMSRVFVATENALGRRVVIKVLPPELGAALSADRFRREIQLAASLQHPLIVPLISAGSDQALLYYTMPYIEGESLRARVAR